MLSHLREHSRALRWSCSPQNVKLFTQTRITRKMALVLCVVSYIASRALSTFQRSQLETSLEGGTLNITGVNNVLNHQYTA